MVTVQIGSWLVVSTDIGTAVFFAGPGKHEAWVNIGNVALSDAVAGKVRRFREKSGTVITSDAPVALWVSHAATFGLHMVSEMDGKSYRKLITAIQTSMSAPDQLALLGQIAYISKWIPSFIPVINGG